MRRGARLAAVACLFGTVSAQVGSHRPLQPGEVTPGIQEYAVDGIDGYTTWEFFLDLDGEVMNAYTFAGSTSEGHGTSIPAGYQVAAPFGANVGGNRPAYWPYNADAQYDSWVTGIPALVCFGPAHRARRWSLSR